MVHPNFVVVNIKPHNTTHPKISGLNSIVVHSQSKMISNDQELIQSDPTSCPQNQKGNN